MNIRLLNREDTARLEEYLEPHKSECMFMYSNLKAAGIPYKGADFQGEYWGHFSHALEQLDGVMVHYWNGNIMMHASDKTILAQLASHLKNTTKRPVEGVLGPDDQAACVIENLGLSYAPYRINRPEGLYEIPLGDLNELTLPDPFRVVEATEVSRDLLVQWMEGYEVEALAYPSGPSQASALRQQAETKVERLRKKDCWVLIERDAPVSLSAFNARLEDRVQVGPVWTPPEHRNKGFARLLLSHTLGKEKRKGTKKAILFTDNPPAIKAYEAVGFKKIGEYRLALLEKPVILGEEIEFTTSPNMADIEFLTEKINKETTDFGAATPFAFFMRGEQGNLVAGVNGSVIFGGIYTDQLWVDKAYRTQGLGKRLMEKVHAYGRERGCSMATVSTMSFQEAKGFYEKLGYSVDFQRSGYNQESRCLFMKKEL